MRGERKELRMPSGIKIRFPGIVIQRGEARMVDMVSVVSVDWAFNAASMLEDDLVGILVGILAGRGVGVVVREVELSACLRVGLCAGSNKAFKLFPAGVAVVEVVVDDDDEVVVVVVVVVGMEDVRCNMVLGGGVGVGVEEAAEEEEVEETELVDFTIMLSL